MAPLVKRRSRPHKAYMMRLLLILLIAMPVLELYLLIEVGSGIGVLNTIALCLGTAAIGGWIVYIQGLNTLTQARKDLAQGHVPAQSGLHGMLLALAGLLLFTPGLISDMLGFVLLIPGLRRLLIRQWPAVHGTRHVWIEGEVINRDDPRLP